MFTDWDKFLISVVLTGCSGRQSDAEQQGLLQDKNEHSGEYGIAVATCCIEYGHFLEVKWLGGYLFISGSKVSRLAYLNVGIDVRGYGQCSLIDSLISEHEAHIAVDAHMGLLTSVKFMGEIIREIE